MANEYLKKILAANLNVDKEQLDTALEGFVTEEYVNQQISAAIARIDALVGNGVIE